jgi:hypothetical protein
LCAGSTLLLGEDAPALSGAIVCSVTKLASITFWSLAFSYWFDKPWFHKLRETCCCAPHTFLLGFPTGCLNIAPSDTLPERGITTGGLLHHHACLRSDVWVVYLGLRVHSSS